MANKHLSRNPHLLRGRNGIWWYEESAGMKIYQQDTAGQVSTLLIPWRAIRPALARKDKPKDA